MKAALSFSCVLGVVLAAGLTGCGLELLTTTAITGELQKDNIQTSMAVLNRVKEQTPIPGIQQSVNAYQAEKGAYPPSLDALVPEFYPSTPKRPDGQSYAYDPRTGVVSDGPAAPTAAVVAGPTTDDQQKLAQLRTAIDNYGRSFRYYPPNLATLVPLYLPTVPKTAAGQDFIYNPQNGSVLHPGQLAQQAAAATAAPAPRARGVGGVGGPMGEAMTGIAIQNQLNGMSNAGASSAQSRTRSKMGEVGSQHTQQQERTMDNLGL